MKSIDNILVTVFVFWWTNGNITGKKETCHSFINKTNPGQSEDFLKEIQPCGYLQCVRECYLTFRCVDILYKQKELFCALTISSVASKTVVNDGNFHAESLLGACNRTVCETALTCVPLSSGIGACIETASCPSNWEHFKSECLFFSNESLSWTDSKHQCEIKGGSLVTVSTPEIYTFIKSKISKGSEDFWIGGVKDSTSIDSWNWTRTNDPIIFSSWMIKVLTFNEVENCLRITSTGVLKDQKCFMIYNYICQL